jgi:predicted HicB family RNase H-like nuclease
MNNKRGRPRRPATAERQWQPYHARFSQAHHEKLRRLAEDAGISINAVLNQLVQKAIEEAS